MARWLAHLGLGMARLELGLGLGMGLLRLGMGLLRLGLGSRLWLGLGMVGTRLGHLEPILGVACLLLQSVARQLVARRRE